jgi:CHAT domain-containing protein/tetratricopeptide (TPR) repeat protein
MRKGPASILLLFLCYSSLTPGSPQDKLIPPQDPYVSALKIIGRGQYEEAFAVLEDLLKRDPMSALAARKMVEAARYLKDTGRAKAAFERLIRENEDSAAAFYGLSLYFLESHDYEAALENARKAIALFSGLPPFYQAFIDTSERLKRLDGAADELVKISEEEPKNYAPLYGLAIVRRKQVRRDEALALLEKAVRLDAGDPLICRLKCDLLQDDGRYKEMLALALDKAGLCEGKDPDLQIDFYTRISTANSVLGDYPAALEYDRKGLDLAREIGSKKSEGIILGNLGVHYANTGNIPQALKLFGEKLALMKELGDRGQQVNTLSNLGALNDWQGNVQESLRRYGEALVILETMDDRAQKALILGNMGAAFEKQSDYPKALDHYRQALEIFQALQDQKNTAWIMGNLGAIAWKLGNDAEALDYFEKALRILQEVGDRKYEGWVLGAMGAIYQRLGDKERSLRSLEDALKIAKEIGDKRLSIDHLKNLGSLYQEKGEFEKASECLKEGLKLAEEIGDRLSLTEVRIIRGTLLRSQKEYDRSIGDFEKALEIGRELGVPRTIWNSHWGLACSHEQKGDYQEALKQYKMALDTVEGIRGKLTTQEQKSGFLGKTINIYEGLINLLFKIRDKEATPGLVEESYQLAERAKSRALLELLAEAKVDLTSGISHELEGEEKKLQTRLTGLQQKLLDPAAKPEDREDLYEELRSVESQYNEFLRALREKSPEYAALTYPQPSTLFDVQSRLLNRGTYLVEFFVGADHTFQWVVSKDKVLLARSFPREHEVFGKIEDYQTQIAQRRINLDVRLGKDIYDVLMKDALREVPASARVIIVPDGLLLRFPFEALVVDIVKGTPKYLVQRHTLTYAPSASVLAEMTARKTTTPADPIDLFALGNPVLEVQDLPDRLPLERRRTGARLEPLPFAEEEVSSISRLYQQNKKSHALYVRENASEGLLKSDDCGRFRILHFATHGLIDDRVPALSGLLLAPGVAPDGDDGYLRLNEIFHLKMNADLVVLSACETALGKVVRGEGMVGLTRAFFYAGARSVIASLWMVNDRSTALLMRGFHAQYLKGKDASAALRQAKVDLLEGKDLRYRHPFFWAPFVLMGMTQPAR